MNKRDKDILLILSNHIYTGQRNLAAVCGCSLGAVNASIATLLKEGYLDKSMGLTVKSKNLLYSSAPACAVLLAAGLGLWIPPHNAKKPTALLEVHGEPLIERLISQLHEVGIKKIYIVVGFAKEQFEYLIDRYGVELIVNSEYAKKNNLHSLALAKEHLNNCYVVPCDLWCRNNPFQKNELYSWYMVSDEEDVESTIRVNRKQELVLVSPSSKGNAMIGISYLLEDTAELIRSRLEDMVPDRRYKGSFWEETLFEDERILISPRVVSSDFVAEIKSLTQLQELETHTTAFVNTVTATISRLIQAPEHEIEDISVLKMGTTNCSVLFSRRNKQYILRIPCREAERLISYQQEAEVYRTISGSAISDEVTHFDPDTGVKISEYIPNARHCDPQNPQDLAMCMKKLRQFHSTRLAVAHEFDLFSSIEHYESLWDGASSVYSDYQTTKENILSLRTYIDAMEKDCCLTHIDAIAENFLISGEDIRLIDWEYAAMQDPHVDIAMFCLHALYDQKQVDEAIYSYFPEGCNSTTKLKIYCYIAVGGLLWSNWCEYKMKHGIEFGAYSLRQYRYAKDYFRIVRNELNQQKEKQNVSG
ncbi:MAG: NTP transferase domain-containing protein [Oscillospiraceae bacterium]|nr:NTP transferase domain-containing protein [Oscillospiraceae bacterium]